MQNQNEFITRRVLEEANYFIDNCSTVRATAKVFNVSKTTVFRDLTVRLPQYSHSLFVQVNSILQINKQERASRGGSASKKNNRKAVK